MNMRVTTITPIVKIKFYQEAPGTYTSELNLVFCPARTFDHIRVRDQRIQQLSILMGTYKPDGGYP